MINRKHINTIQYIYICEYICGMIIISNNYGAWIIPNILSMYGVYDVAQRVLVSKKSTSNSHLVLSQHSYGKWPKLKDRENLLGYYLNIYIYHIYKRFILGYCRLSIKNVDGPWSICEMIIGRPEVLSSFRNCRPIETAWRNGAMLSEMSPKYVG
jgi:hypothetical protein